MRKIMKFKVIAAVCENMGIGAKGSIPWRLNKEMKYFSRMTSGTKDPEKKNVVIMGKRTWNSIPSKFKPLPNRLNIVISNSMIDSGYENVSICKSLDDALTKLGEKPLFETVEDIWIIGGEMLYKEAINSPLCDAIYLTRIHAAFDCDVFFPEIPSHFQETCEENVPVEVQEENGLSFRYTVLRPHKEK